MDILKYIISDNIKIEILLPYTIALIAFGYIAIKTFLNKNSYSCFSFKGRLGRKYFAKNMAISLAFYFIIVFIWLYFKIGFNFPILGGIFLFFYFCNGLFCWSNITRRFHDLNHSWIFAFALFILTELENVSMYWSFINLFVYLYLFFKKGTDGVNTYGDDPILNNTQEIL